MRDLYASGRMLDVILALVLVEAAVLVAWMRRTKRGPGAVAMLLGLLPGVFLLAAVREALVRSRWEAVATLLTLALVAHCADLRRRFARG
jgi:hypothetical protein